MSMIISPCEEEPPEPDEQLPHIVALREDAKSGFPLHSPSLFILQCEVKIQAASKLKSRSGRSSSLLSIRIVYNDRYIPQRLSIAWKKALNSLEYFPLSRELPNNPVFDVAQTRTQIPSVGRVLPSDPVDAIDNHESKFSPSDAVSEVNALRGTLCIPTIIITPPETSDGAADVSCNAIPTPQDSAFGFYLTVPDFDSKVINNRHGYEGRRIATEKRFDVLVNHGSTHTDGAQPKFDATVSRRNYASFDDEEEEVIDLGPTWCG